MDVQTATVVITGISIIIGVILSINSRKQELETRQAQLFMQIYNRWTSQEVTKSYGALRYKYLEQDWIAFCEDLFSNRQGKNPDVDLDWYSEHQMLATFFEGLGILVKKDLVDLSMVEDLFSSRLIWYWETQILPLRDVVRTYQHDSTLYDSIEYLYNELKQREQQATS